MPSRAAPLSGIRVVEIGHSVAAPYAALVLAELGAEVVKIERPGKGDDARGWGPPFAGDSSAVFHALNRLKRSVTLDLKNPDDVTKLKRLSRISDVVIQNLKPGLAARLGIGPDDLRAENPRLIYASIHAFGRKGPLRERPGYDPLMQAFGGLMSVTGHPGAEPARIGPSIIDMGTGMWVALGVVTALFRRAETGRGGVVDTSLFETALGWMTYFVAMWSASGRVPGRMGSGTLMIVPYQAFRTADGFLMIGGANDAHFARICSALGHPDWADDPRFRTNADRVANRETIVGLITAETERLTTAELAARLDALGVPNAPVHDVAEAANHPQTAALGILHEEPGTGVKYFGLPMAFEGMRPWREGVTPALGADNAWLEWLLAEAGDEPGGSST